MSRGFICDGCGKTSEGELTCLGHVVKRDYCADCLLRVEEFQRGIEISRKRLVESFKIERATMIERFRADNFKLPDVLDKIERDDVA